MKQWIITFSAVLLASVCVLFLYRHLAAADVARAQWRELSEKYIEQLGRLRYEAMPGSAAATATLEAARWHAEHTPSAESVHSLREAIASFEKARIVMPRPQREFTEWKIGFPIHPLHAEVADERIGKPIHEIMAVVASMEFENAHAHIEPLRECITREMLAAETLVMGTDQKGQAIGTATKAWLREKALPHLAALEKLLYK